MNLKLLKFKMQHRLVAMRQMVNFKTCLIV